GSGHCRATGRFSRAARPILARGAAQRRRIRGTGGRQRFVLYGLCAAVAGDARRTLRAAGGAGGSFPPLTLGWKGVDRRFFVTHLRGDAARIGGWTRRVSQRRAWLAR